MNKSTEINTAANIHPSRRKSHYQKIPEQAFVPDAFA